MNHRPTLMVSALLPALLAVACATSRNVLPVRQLDRPPYYYSYVSRLPPAGSNIAHVPVRADPGMGFELSASTLEPLLDAMTEFLDGARWTRRLDSLPRPVDEGPRLYVGSVDGEGAPGRDSAERAAYAELTMIVQADEPTERWRKDLRGIAESAGVEYVIVVYVGLSQYVIRDAPTEVELGTGHVVRMSWLTAIAHHADVLHLTGALLAKDGRVLRVGAEGILARKPNVLLSLFDVRTNVRTEDVTAVLTDYRRGDMPGAPLAWQVALEQLITQLLRRPVGLR
ncbi:MAG: hypothetical protein ACREMF_05170 [Gemmatimonadales bacterium]